jgi:phospholipid/cholesterol/gamma-HCH transport system permease protein
MMALPGSPDIRVEGGAVRCRGSWTVDRIGRVARALGDLEWPVGVEVVLDASGVDAMDTAGAWLLHRTAYDPERPGRTVILRLRPEHQRMLQLVISSGFVRSPPPVGDRVGVVEALGRKARSSAREIGHLVSFFGETAVTARRALTGPLWLRWRQVLQHVQTAGFEALPTAALLSFSIGVVIAHQGSSLFRPFGAGILVADLVGLATLRELSPLVIAIIAAARSGSAYAAQIGAMKITGEIDSLRAVGASPIEVLVLPRVAALAIALPLLTVSADVAGVAGGMVVARSELAIDRGEFFGRIAHTIQPSDYLVGLVKAPVFGCIVAAIGCYQGLHAADDADSVGRRTTVAVVQSIFLVIVADAFFGVLSRGFGI